MTLEAAAYSHALRARLMGPALRGGRVTAVAGHPFDPQVFYFGRRAGGVWKTTDGGGTGTTSPTGTLQRRRSARSPSPNPIRTWSTSAWARRPSAATSPTATASTSRPTPARHGAPRSGRDAPHRARCASTRRDPDSVYVAALGHATGPTRSAASIDRATAAQTWEHVLFAAATRARSISSMDPTNPRILYAAFWEAPAHPVRASPAAARAAGCSSRPTAATPGRS